MFLTIFPIVISVIALLISLFNFLYSLYINRTKVDIIVDITNTLYCYKGLENHCFVPCQIVNGAGREIAITGITLVNELGEEVKAVTTPHFVRTKLWYSPDTGKTYEDIIYTEGLPINLIAYSGKYGVLRFDLENEMNYNYDRVVIETNKRTITSRKTALAFSNAMQFISEQKDKMTRT